jgi:hypothetical protein
LALPRRGCSAAYDDAASARNLGGPHLDRVRNPVRSPRPRRARAPSDSLTPRFLPRRHFRRGGAKTDTRATDARSTTIPEKRKASLERGFRVVGGTALEPVTPSLSTRHRRSRRFARVRFCLQILRFSIVPFATTERERTFAADIEDSASAGADPASPIVDGARTAPRRGHSRLSTRDERHRSRLKRYSEAWHGSGLLP